MLNLSDYDFHLPEHLISQQPYQNRTHCNLLKCANGIISDHKFYDLVDLIDDDCLLVFNNTSVSKARYLFDYNGSTSEIFFLENLGQNSYRVFLRKSSKFKIGNQYDTSDFIFEVLEKQHKTCIIRVIDNSNIGDVLSDKGLVPLPPYIKIDNPNDYYTDYQTVYASHGESVAAPTAGLHFDLDLLEKLKAKGVDFAYVNLTVGLGTFATLSEENIKEKKLHEETFSLLPQDAQKLNKFKQEGRKIIAVGTTSLRCLQSAFDFELDEFVPQQNSTEIFIYPPFDNFVVDGLITNFHLPKSSLFLLISAFIGSKKAMQAYLHAIELEYKFYSFGDACLFMR